jgi:wobble nucleotide-excising tRNase
MIERLEIARCATYGETPEIMDGLSTFNFVYGPNSAGKTTATRIIANPDAYPDSKVQWRAGAKLESLVYNRDFVAENFNQPTGLKGIFTLGKKDIETLAKIDAAKREEESLRQALEGLTNTMGGADGKSGKIGELAAIELNFKEECWKLKQKHDAKLRGALEGYRGDSQKFKDKIIYEKAANNAELLPQAELEKKAETIFGPSPSVETALSALDDMAFLAAEADPILKKRVIGKQDVDIAGMIQKLGNSDWVKQGLGYYAANDRYCPFCQQMTPSQLAVSLAEYFDEQFEKDSSAIASLNNGYKLGGERLQQNLQAILSSGSRFLDVERLRAEKEIFESRYRLNLQRVDSKRKEPSQLIDLEPLDDVLNRAKELIASANEKIVAHNAMVANLVQERQRLTRQVWKFLVEVEIKDKFSAYEKKKSDVRKAIDALQTRIDSATAAKETNLQQIRQLERTTTSIQPTVNEINRLLAGFGFRSFSLAPAQKGNYYFLRRPDGRDAQGTLSEGEQSFIAFLYFYHLLKGSNSESGVTTDRIVVFDDPVSSLDSDILFIVGTLIKELFEDVREGKGNIKQIFIFTHNIYFHKQVTFNVKRTGGVMNEETFWTIRKSKDLSKVKKHDSNPVKTSYELLWSEVRTPDPSSHTIQNTLRRILEYYFKILGNIDFGTISGLFEGKERMICNSLITWAHDGSHSVFDDLYVSADGSAEAYLGVFRKIFKETGQFDHYKMMMGNAYAETPEIAQPAI